MSANDLEGEDIWGGGESKEAEIEDDETRHMSIGELRQRIHLLNNDIRIMKSDVQRITHESRAQRDRIRDNQEKVKLNKQLPYLVANVVEILEPHAEDGTNTFYTFSRNTSPSFFSHSHSCLVLSYVLCYYI
jgi:26S proteasome regulatory subunit T5